MSHNTTSEVSWTQTRRDTARHRRGPKTGLRVIAAAGSGGKIPPGAGDATSTILIEATDNAGEIVNWLDDAWWSDLFQRWAPDPFTIEIAPTPGSLLHPIVLHQLEMVRRVVANWHIVGEGYVSDVGGDDDVEQLATGPFHELRFREGSRPNSANTEPPESRFEIDELFERIRARTQLAPFDAPALLRLARGGG